MARSMLTWPQWPTPGAHQMLAGLAFQAYSGQDSPLRRSTGLSSTFILHVMPKLWNHSVFLRKTHILGGHDRTLPSKFCLPGVQNCTWNYSRVLTWPQWPTPGAHQMLAGLAFQAYSGQNSPLRRSTGLSSTFIPHVMPKQWNHWFFLRKTHTSWWSRAHFATQILPL